jgi:type IV pilus assembly protein PilV
MKPNSRPQRGVMLLEVLIALLIFALGVLGLVGLQARAARDSSQTKYRADATLLANDLLGQMWLTSRDYATLNAAFTSSGSGGARYNTWNARVANALPGAAANPPTVVLAQVQPLPAIVAGASAPATGLTSSSQVTITVYWKAPGEPAADAAHKIVLVNEIR